jgi:hypothetical protein
LFSFLKAKSNPSITCPQNTCLLAPALFALRVDGFGGAGGQTDLDVAATRETHLEKQKDI